MSSELQHTSQSRLNEERDPRIDVIRGLALLVVYSDHIEGNVFSSISLLALGGADFADVFVFLSGLACGIAYSRRLVTYGWWSCLRQLLYRAFTIYVALVLTALVCAGLSQALSRWTSTFDNPLLSPELPRFRGNPMQSLGELMKLRMDNGNLSILKLYICLLAIFPMVLMLGRASAILAFVVSTSLYCFVQVWPRYLQFPEPWQLTVAYNLFAWQFLFVTAALIGIHLRSIVIPRGLRRWLLCSATLIFQVLFFWNVLAPGESRRWSSKFDLGPLRILQLLSMAILFALLTERSSRLWSHHLRWLAICGRYSLTVFCAGVLYSSVATWIMFTIPQSVTLQIAVNVIGWIMCLMTGQIAAWSHRTPSTKAQDGRHN